MFTDLLFLCLGKWHIKPQALFQSKLICCTINATKGKDLLMEVGKCLILCYAHEVAMKETFLGQMCILILKFGFLKIGALMSEEIN